MKTVILDLNQIKSEKEFHDLVVKELSFPDYYGENLDALWDCINEITEETTVDILGLNNVSNKLRIFIDRYIETLKEYQEESQGEFKVRILK